MLTTDLLEQTTEIVSSYVSRNPLGADELSALIAEVHRALAQLDGSTQLNEPQPAQSPAVPVKKSITPEYLICLDDGLRFKSLKRHLAGLGMTPDQYRTKWKLPGDYPMVAPAYAAKRSEVAKATGLGTKLKASAPATDAPKRGRGRPKKTEGLSES